MEILCAVNAQQLIDEYAAECSVADADPQVELYAAVEQAGALHCFGAYVTPQRHGPVAGDPVAGDELVGFISVLNSPMLHNGKRVATIESFFVLAAHRRSGAGNRLLAAAKAYASESGCLGLLYTARIGSRLEKVLSRRAGCERSHTVFTEWL